MGRFNGGIGATIGEDDPLEGAVEGGALEIGHHHTWPEGDFLADSCGVIPGHGSPAALAVFFQTHECITSGVHNLNDLA